MAAERGSLEPWLKDSIVFYEHQVDGVRQLARMKSFLLADDMGLGKTLQALAVFCIDIVLGRAKTCIVVCPVTLRNNWADEIRTFTNLPYTLLGEIPHPTRPGETKQLPASEREVQLIEWFLQEHPRILITNYEQICKHKDLLSVRPVDIAYFDEAHYIQNPDSERTKATLKLLSQRSGMLTGTPFRGNIMGLWAILKKIDPELFPSEKRFRNRYVVYGGHKNKQIVGVKNKKELIEILSKVMLRRLKKDVLKLKEPYYVQIPVDLHPKQKELYDSLKEEYTLKREGEEDKFIEWPLVRFGRLKEIASTTAGFMGEDNSYKLDRAVEICQELLDQGEKVVVFTQFRKTLECFTNRLTGLGITKFGVLHGDVPNLDRTKRVREWSEWPEPAPMVCMLQVAGVGLNMTAASSVIFLDKLWDPGDNRQAVDRVHRIGADETKTIQVFEMYVRGTVEQRVEEILRNKKTLFDSIVGGSMKMRFLFEELEKTGG